MIELGKQYTDSITGFTGIATARTVYLNGCVRVALQGKVDKDGKIAEAEWIDETQLIPKSAVPADAPKITETGGPGPVPPSRDAPAW